MIAPENGETIALWQLNITIITKNDIKIEIKGAITS